jgi:predicted amidohydrolase
MSCVIPWCEKGRDSTIILREAPMADYDILIRGGTIVDGTRTPRYVSDIGIKDGKIAQIGGLKGKTADRTLHAARCGLHCGAWLCRPAHAL